MDFALRVLGQASLNADLIGAAIGADFGAPWLAQFGPSAPLAR